MIAKCVCCVCWGGYIRAAPVGVTRQLVRTNNGTFIHLYIPASQFYRVRKNKKTFPYVLLTTTKKSHELLSQKNISKPERHIIIPLYVIICNQREGLATKEITFIQTLWCHRSCPQEQQKTKNKKENENSSPGSLYLSQGKTGRPLGPAAAAQQTSRSSPRNNRLLIQFFFSQQL